MGFNMSKQSTSMNYEFECPGCKEKLPLGTKNCKWCGTYIASPPTTPVEMTPDKKSFLNRVFKKS